MDFSAMGSMGTVADTRVRKEIGGPVGFSQLPHQLHRELLKTGFEFSVMVVGESGLGKSTLLNSLFFTDLYTTEDYPPTERRVSKTMTIESTSIELEENGVKLDLTVIDTPGFGDNLNNSDLMEKLVGFVEKQYDRYVDLENRVNRIPFKDTRIHACLYFISPTAHGLRQIDVEFLKALHKKINLIPVIAKADTFNSSELQRFKQRVLEDLHVNGIEIFKSVLTQDAAQADVDAAKSLLNSMPFAVVGSNTVLEIDGKKVRGRKYPWGVVNVESEDTSDFVKLRDVLIRKHMRDLYDHTHQVLYEDYRLYKFANLGLTSTTSSNLIEAFEEEKKEHERQMKKIEEDLRKVFEQKVREKENDLKLAEKKMEEEYQAQLVAFNKEKEAYERKLVELQAEKDKQEREKAAAAAKGGVAKKVFK